MSLFVRRAASGTRWARADCPPEIAGMFGPSCGTCCALERESGPLVERAERAYEQKMTRSLSSAAAREASGLFKWNPRQPSPSRTLLEPTDSEDRERAPVQMKRAWLTNLSSGRECPSGCRSSVRRVPYVYRKNAQPNLARMAVIQKSINGVVLLRPEKIPHPVWSEVHRETLTVCLVRPISQTLSAHTEATRRK